MTEEQEAREREAFEASALARYCDLRRFPDTGEYINTWTQGRWEGYLARAESAVLAEAVAEVADTFCVVRRTSAYNSPEMYLWLDKLREAVAAYREGRR